MSETESEDLNNKVEKLENRVERLDERTKGTNSIEMRAYDLSVSMRSEEAGMEKLARIASSEMNEMMERALIGEYQELEQEELHSILFGGD